MRLRLCAVPFVWQDDAQPAQRLMIETGAAYPFPAQASRKRGRGTILRSKMVEGAPESTLCLHRKRYVDARAPTTALLRSVVPLPRLRSGG